jgi:hypothetical protein
MAHTHTLRHKRYQHPFAILIIVLVAATGVYFLARSHAISPYVNGEAESGTRSGTTTLGSDTSASGSAYVGLGTAVASTGPGINSSPTGPSTPSGGWHVDLADDFNAPLGTSSGQDNLWYPNQAWDSPASSNANGDNSYETEVYNSSHVSVNSGNLVLTATYDNDVAAATSSYVQRNYVAGMVTSPVGISGYKGFNWTPGTGSTLAFEIDCQFPQDTGELFNAWWTSSQTNWYDEHDFFEGHNSQSVIDSDWIYQTSEDSGGFAQDFYQATLGFDPAAAMHRYTYVIYANQSWSLYIDGQLQTWVGTNGVAPARSSNDNPMMLIANYALNANTFTSGTRQFLINSIAVYQDGDHISSGITGGGVAPGTVVN